MSSFVQYAATGATQTFSVTFPYLNRLHVSVKVNGIPVYQPLHYEWLTDASIRFQVAPSGTVEIRRNTELNTPLVDFTNGTVLTEDDLNVATLQNLYLAQELSDRLTGYIEGGVAVYTGGTLSGTTTQERIDAAAAAVLDSALLADLEARIVDIDANAESIIATNVALADIQDQVDALGTIDTSGIGTLITNEANARIAGDQALIDTVALIGAKSGDNTAFIANLDTLRVGPTESLATRLAALTASDGANTAAIVAEQITRANADSSFAADISTLQSTVGGNSAAISTLQTVSNGLVAQYMVKLDVNGYVSGFGLYNAAGSSAFTVLADKFAVVTPGGTAKVPFSIVDGVVYANDLVVKNANIETLTVGKLTSGILTAGITQNADWAVGTGRIVFDSLPGSASGIVRISGVGFGPSGQYLEWFGPKPAGYTTVNDIVANINDASAIQYLKLNGDAYFGGSLSAGILTNRATTSSLLSTASVSTGEFGTNGNTKVYTISYSWSNATTTQVVGGAGATDGGAVSATVRVDRTKGATFTSGYGTLNVAGTWGYTTDTDPIEDVFPLTYIRRWTESMSGSITITDSEAGLDDRTLAATITARSLQIGGTSLRQQRLTVLSVEE